MVETNSLEMVSGMRDDGHRDTITQTAQVLDLGDGRKATVCITVTTDQELFL